jgi:hypothetical protein
MSSYLPKMRAFRKNGAQPAAASVGAQGRTKRKSLRSKNRARTLKKRVSAREGVFAVGEARMAGKKKSAKGRSAGRRRPGGSKRTAKKTVKRDKGALGRRADGKFAKHPRHVVRGHMRKAKGRRKKTLVRRHLSHESGAATKKRRRRARAANEETAMKRKRRAAKRRAAPRKRRRAVAAENPRPRKRRRARVARENPRPRKRRRAKRAAPARRRRRAIARENPVRKRRRARRNPLGKRRSAKAFVRSYRKAKHPKVKYIYVAKGGRKRAKRSGKRRGASRRRGTAGMTVHGASAVHPYPYGQEYAMENPLSGGELALAVATAAAGYIGADYLDRWLAYKELGPSGSALSTSPVGAAMTPGMAALSKPGMWRVLAQAGFAAVPLGLTYYVRQPMGRAALQGFGIGAAVHGLSQIFIHYVVVPMLGGVTAPATGATPTMTQTMNAYYTPEIVADNVETQAMTGTMGTLIALGVANGSAQGTLNGFHRGLGATDGLRAHRVPRALAASPAKAGVGGCGGGCGGGTAPTDGGGCGDGSGDCAQPDMTQPPAVVVVSPPAASADIQAAAAAATASTQGTGAIPFNLGSVPWLNRAESDQAAE